MLFGNAFRGIGLALQSFDYLLNFADENLRDALINFLPGLIRDLMLKNGFAHDQPPAAPVRGWRGCLS